MGGFDVVLWISIGLFVAWGFTRWWRMRPTLVRQLNTKAQHYIDQENYAAALQVLDQVLEREPHSWEALQQRAFVLYRQGKLEAAKDVYTTLIRNFPLMAPTYYNLGVLFWEQAHLDEAFACFSEAIRLQPQALDAYIARGKVLFAQGNFAAALEAAEQMSGAGAVAAGAELRLAVLFEQKKYPVMLYELDQLITAYPTEPRWYWLQATCLHQQAEYEHSFNATAHLIKLDPTHAEAWMLHSELAVRLARWETAHSALDHAATLQPPTPLLYTLQAVVAHKAGQLTTALELLDRVLLLTPDDPGLYIQRAQVLLECDQHSAALADLHHAQKLGLHLSEQWFSLALAAWRLEQKSLAREACQQAMHQPVPAAVLLHTTLAQQAGVAADTLRAELRPLLEHPNGEVVAHVRYVLAWLAILESKPILALPYAQQAAQFAPAGQFHDALAACYALRAEWEAAEQAWTLALEWHHQHCLRSSCPESATLSNWLAATRQQQQPLTPPVLDQLLQQGRWHW